MLQASRHQQPRLCPLRASQQALRLHLHQQSHLHHLLRRHHITRHLFIVNLRPQVLRHYQQQIRQANQAVLRQQVLRHHRHLIRQVSQAQSPQLRHQRLRHLIQRVLQALRRQQNRPHRLL